MARGGPAWRGYFPVGAELTSGQPDLKEGLYFGAELGDDDPRVRAGLPLHGLHRPNAGCSACSCLTTSSASLTCPSMLVIELKTCRTVPLRSIT